MNLPTHPRRTRRTLLLTSLLVLTAACGGAPKARSSATVRGTPPATIVLVIMENSNYDGVVGNPAMPFLNDTIVPGSLSLTSMHGNAHPSLPNYVWMAAGEACGATDNEDWDRDCPSLYDQLTKQDIAWTTYAEGYPGGGSTCSLEPTDQATHYARKHVPPLLFTSTSQGAACSNIEPFPGTPAPDGAPVANFANLKPAAFTVIVPSLCHDMHDRPAQCGSAGGGPVGADRWLQLNWADLVAAAGPHGVVILTWDESDGGDPPIPTFIAGQGIEPGEDDATYDHASTLRAIQDTFGLPCLAGACDAAPLPIGLQARG